MTQHSDTETIKEELSLRAEMDTFKAFIMVELLEVKMEKNENSQVETNLTTGEIELSQDKNLTGVKHPQYEIKFLQEEIVNKNEIIKKTLLKNINCSEKISQILNSSYNDYQKA